MRALKVIGIYVEENDGAVTVDFMLLAPALIGIAIATMLSIQHAGPAQAAEAPAYMPAENAGFAG